MVIHIKHPTFCSWAWLVISLCLTVFVAGYAWQVRNDHLHEHKYMAVLEQAIDEAPVGIAMADLSTGMSTFRNQRLIALTGCTVHDVNDGGGPTTQYGDVTQWKRLLDKVNGMQVFDEKIKMKRSKGGAVDLRLVAFPIRRDPQVIIGFFMEAANEHPSCEQ